MQLSGRHRKSILVSALMGLVMVQAAFAVSTNPTSFSETLDMSESVTRQLTIINGLQEVELQYEISVVGEPPTGNLVHIPDSVGTVADGGIRSIDVIFNATNVVAGTYDMTLELAHNDPGFTSPLEIPATVVVNPTMTMVIAPTSFDFGTLWAFTDSTTEFVLVNTGNAPIEVSDVSIDDASFSHDATLPLTVPAFASASYHVTYAPTAPAAAFSTTMTVTSDADEPDNELTVQLDAEAIQGPEIVSDVSSVDEIIYEPETETTVPIVLTNNGGDDLEYLVNLDYDNGTSSDYTWADSDDPGGPAYRWVDISTSGTRLEDVSTTDDEFEEVDLTFAFPFYGNSYSSVFVGTNGFLTFGTGHTTYINDALPGTSCPPNLIAPFFDDLDPRDASSHVYFQDFGDSAIVQYELFRHYSYSSSEDRYTFQVVLHADGQIDYYYESMEGVLNSATIGIQDASQTQGLQVAYNQAYVYDGLAVEILPPWGWMTLSRSSGTIPAGESQTIDLTLRTSAAVLDYGNFTGSLEITHNVPDPSFDNPLLIDTRMRWVDPRIAAYFAEANPTSVTEGDLDNTLTVSLAEAQIVDVTVPFTVGGTADASDHSLVAGNVLINEGDLTGTVSFDALTDAIDEDLEQIVVTLGAPDYGVLGEPSVHTVDLVDANDPPSVAFDLETADYDEDAGTVTITASLSEASGLDVLVPFDVSGTAGENDHDLAGRDTILISAGETSSGHDVVITDDALDEDPETMVLTMDQGALVNATAGAVTTHTGTIVDNDPLPSVSLTTDAQTVTEGQQVTVAVLLNTSSGRDCSVHYSVGGTCGSGEHTLTEGVFAFEPSGETRDTVRFNVEDDGLDEATETIVVTLDQFTNCEPGTPIEQTITVEDNNDEPFADFVEETYTVGEDVGVHNVVVEISAVSGLDVTVPVTVITGERSYDASDPDDYTITSTTVTIEAGETQANVEVNVVDDALDEYDEYVVLQMGDPTNAQINPEDPPVVDVVIADNDDTPTVEFTAGAQSVDEDAGTVTATVELSAVSGRYTRVFYTITEGTTASYGDDFDNLAPIDMGGEVPTPIIEIPAGQQTATITFDVIDDAIDELDEVVELFIGGGENVLEGTTLTHVVTIVDNDDPPVLSFTEDTQTVDEDVNLVTVTAEIDAVSGLDVSVPFTVSGTAVNPDDHDLGDGTILIEAGDVSAEVTFIVVNDDLDEDHETVILTMGTPANATAGATTMHEVTITDDDDATLSFALADQTVGENVGTVTVEAILSNESVFDVSVPFTVAGTATNPDDHDLVAGTIEILAGATSATVEFDVVDGLLDELDETVILAMTEAELVNAAPGEHIIHTVTIEDNDDAVVNWLRATQTIRQGAEVWVTAELSLVSTRDVTVNFTVGGTARQGADYYGLSASEIVIPAGETHGSVQFNTTDGAIDGLDVVFTQTNVVNAGIGAVNIHTATIDRDADFVLTVVPGPNTAVDPLGDVNVAPGGSQTVAAYGDYPIGDTYLFSEWAVISGDPEVVDRYSSTTDVTLIKGSATVLATYREAGTVEVVAADGTDLTGASISIYAANGWVGEQTMVGPGSETPLLPGLYTLSVVSSGYRTEYIPFEIEPGATTTVEVTLRGSVPVVFTDPVQLRDAIGIINVYEYNTSAFGDMDADGDDDLLIGKNSGYVQYYDAVGKDLTLQSEEIDLGMTGLQCLRTGDVNADNHIDIVAGFDNGEIYWYQNTGGRTFMAGQLLWDAGGAVALTGFDVADLDGDAEPDVIAGYADGTVAVDLSGDTDPFAAVQVSGGPLAVAGNATPVAMDLNGDSQLDLIVGDVNGDIQWFSNNGDGTFAARGMVNAGGLPLSVEGNAAVSFVRSEEGELPSIVISSDAGYVYQAQAILMGDFDDDGQVFLVDFSMFVDAWRTEEGDPNWAYEPNLDLSPNGNGNQEIFLIDYSLFISAWRNEK